jgi:hypothetical protein
MGSNPIAATNIMTKKIYTVTYTVSLLDSNRVYEIVRKVSKQEYENNDISYWAALIAKNGFHLEEEVNIWIPPHRIKDIIWLSTNNAV